VTWLLPPVAFGLKRDGIALEAAAVESAITTGITAELELPGLVPPFDEYSSMTAANYTETEWAHLSADARARAVAHWRLTRLVRLHENDVVNKRAKRNAR